MPQFENPSVAGPEFRNKHKRGRPKREHRRYVSEAAPRFGNLCVYEPSALRKKPSDSSGKTFRFSEEAFRFSEEAFRLRWSRTANVFRKGVPNRGINFKDAYRNSSIRILANPLLVD